jgi:hypothetical protein
MEKLGEPVREACQICIDAGAGIVNFYFAETFSGHSSFPASLFIGARSAAASVGRTTTRMLMTNRLWRP